MQFVHPQRTITVADMEKWFGPRLRPKLTITHYTELAEYFTLARWPSDKPDPTTQPDILNTLKAAEISICREIHAATSTVASGMEAVHTIWISNAVVAERQSGYEALKRLENAAVQASPILARLHEINKRPVGWKRPKLWHIYSVVFAQVVIRTLVDAGHKRPPISKNSVVVRVVHQLMVRMGFPDASMMSRSAVAMHLTRCNENFPIVITAVS